MAPPARAAARAVGQPVPQALPRGVPALPARARVAGPRRRSCARRPRASGITLNQHAGRARGDPRRAALRACSRTSGCATPRGASTWARAARASRIFPGSALARKPPTWVMVAELVETSRLWGRTAARIEPRWVEPLAEHLVKRTYEEPRWERDARVGRRDRARDAVRAADRRRAHGRLRRGSTRSCRASCSSAARWSRATGRRGTSSSPPTAALLEEVEALEAPRPAARHPRRRPGAVRLLRRADPRRRRLRRALRPLVARRARRATRTCSTSRASCWSTRRRRRARPRGRARRLAPGRRSRSPLCYVLRARAPSTTASPSTCRSRCSPQLRPDGFEWLVPAFRAGARDRADPLAAEGAAAAARAGARRRGGRCSSALEPRREPLLDALARALERLRGVRIPREAWDLEPAAAAPADDVPGRGRARRAGRRGHTTSTRCARRSARGCARSSRPPPRRSSAAGCAAWTIGDAAAGRRAARHRRRCAPTRRSSTRATTVGVRVLESPGGAARGDARRARAGCWR